MTPPIPDMLYATILFLQADHDIADLVDTRVFSQKVPQDQVSLMPRPCIVLRRSGTPGYGATDESYMRLSGTRVDVWAYAETNYLADEIYRAVHPTLKYMERNVQNKTVLHWSKHGGGPLSDIDPQTTWPFVWSSWQIMWSEQEVGT